MAGVDGGRWLSEPIRPDVLDMWRLDTVLHEAKTPYQHVVIARTRLGVTLFCDDDPQSAECGELAFHEAELVPAMLLAERVRRVLVIGCGEGTVCRIAVEAGAEHVDHVDIDQECVWACARHLPYGYDLDQVAAAERGDGAIRLHYADGGQFVLDALRSGTRYDVVVLDLPEEQDGSETGHNALYGTRFLACCRDLLEPGGVVATHVSRPYLSLPAADSVASLVRPWRRFAEVFGTSAYFRSAEQPWGAVMLGRTDPVADPVRHMIDRLPALRYRPKTIDAATLASAATPPAVLRRA
jgi:spermidine synthase